MYACVLTNKRKYNQTHKTDSETIVQLLSVVGVFLNVANSSSNLRPRGICIFCSQDSLSSIIQVGFTIQQILFLTKWCIFPHYNSDICSRQAWKLLKELSSFSKCFLGWRSCWLFCHWTCRSGKADQPS